MEGRVSPDRVVTKKEPETPKTDHNSTQNKEPELTYEIKEAIDKMRPSISLLQQWQSEKITLCVGGKCFHRTRSTLMKEPTSLISIPCGLYNVYKEPKVIIDIDPSHFKFILNYLRYDCNMPLGCLPNNLQVLHKLKQTANFTYFQN